MGNPPAKDDKKNEHRRDDQHQPGPGGFRPKAVLIWLLMVIAIVAIVQMIKPQDQSVESDFNKLQSYLANNQVDSVVVEDRKVTVELRGVPDTQRSTVVFNIPPLYANNVMDRLHEYETANPDVSFTWGYQEPHWFAVAMATWMPWIIMLALIWFLLTRAMRSPGAGSVLSFGKSRARMSKRHTGVTFDDVAGVEEAKQEVQEIVEFLKNPTKFERLGGRVPHGMLLVGSPGTGKTLLAKAIAGEADRPFFSISGSDFVEMFVGVGASRVRDLFRQAKENAPCIIFLDEIDAVGRRRGTGLGGGHDEREQTLNAILVEMDGFDSDNHVILIAATNRPDVLDPALLRPGRFDRQVVVDPPDINGREQILKVHARKVRMVPDIDMRQIARGTVNFSGADLANLINESAIIAVIKGKEYIELDDLEDARDKVCWGRQKKSKAMSDEERRLVAIHETGHALVGKLLEPDVDPIHKVGIIPRGMSLGATMYLPKEDSYLMRRKTLVGNITVALAGRAAEEMLSDDITSGAQNDLEVATKIARLMVCKWGMTDDLGPIDYSEGQETLFLGREITRSHSVSEDTARRIDAAVRTIIDGCHKKARELLEDHKDSFGVMTEALLEYEVLDGHEVELILEGKPIERKPAEPAPKPKPAAEKPDPKPADDTLPDFREGIQPA